MNAILYAAGRGCRLAGEGGAPHKILLEFNGRSLLDRHVGHLVSLGVGRIVVVTGHERISVASGFEGLRGRHGVVIEEVFNPDHCEGSVLSMAVSIPLLEQTGDRVLLLDGDVLYGREMLCRLVESAHRTALLVDRGYSRSDEDPVLVPLRDGRPVDFVKRWSGRADAVGESIGFFKVDAADVPVLIRETRARMDGARRADSYDDVLRVLVRAGLFGAEDVTGLPWTEIDFPGDLEYARRVILPALEERD
jgi:choline kinase